MAKRKDKGDIQFPPPREKCKHCWNWCTQADVGFNDIPQCSCGTDYDAQRYMDGSSEDCPKFSEY